MDESGEGQGNLINFLPKAQGRKNSLIILMSMSGKIKNIEMMRRTYPSIFTLIWRFFLFRSREPWLQRGRGCVRSAGGGRDRGGRGGVLHDAGAQVGGPQEAVWDSRANYRILILRTRLIVMSRREAWSPVDTWQLWVGNHSKQLFIHPMMTQISGWPSSDPPVLHQPGGGSQTAFVQSGGKHSGGDLFCG